MGRKSRRINIETTKTGLEVTSCYCRKCMLTKPVKEFYDAVDLDIDSSGKFSVCKDCITELYNKFLPVEGSIEKTVLKLCRMLNLKYSQEAIESAKSQIITMEASGKTNISFMGVYKAKLTTTTKAKMSERSSDLTYSEVTSIIIPNTPVPSGNDVARDVVRFWGKGYTKEDYEWLETRLDEWKKSHKCDTTAEETLLKEIVFKQFEIEKARATEKATGTLVKELQDLMKTASVDPSKTPSDNGRVTDTFGILIKIIEEQEPAEFYKDKDLFKDFDNIGLYFYKYVTRPLKNFITGSRDFNLDVDESGESDDDIADDIQSQLDNMNLNIEGEDGGH